MLIGGRKSTKILGEQAPGVHLLRFTYMIKNWCGGSKGIHFRTLKEALTFGDKMHHIRTKHSNWAFYISLFTSEANPADL